MATQKGIRDAKNSVELMTVWMDLWFSSGLIENRISDAKSELTDAKRQKTKINRSLAKVSGLYEKIHGRVPKMPKKYL